MSYTGRLAPLVSHWTKYPNRRFATAKYDLGTTGAYHASSTSSLNQCLL
jgi:hypothetical protein